MRTGGLAGGGEARPAACAENGLQPGDGGRRGGKLTVVGIGPGSRDQITPRAERALRDAQAVVGYDTYLDLLGDLIRDKEIHRSQMREEIERCRLAVGLALTGKRVAVVSSGDPGVYGMAGPILEVLGERGLAVEIIPGVTAATAAAAAVGAPLNHDFAVISLSDLLTPWPVIEKRLAAAATGDFVTVLYNPRSKKRREQIVRAREIFLKCRKETTPVGIVKNVSRESEEVVITNLRKMCEHPVDMLTTVIIGNSQTFVLSSYMITPRGYRL
ncbi:MAG: precorrin-3B C(17)-methyltransferase [Armatimonadetes bacterium]|nr:precorrin-3B C(17)-methyltransferase [Armatimonadota bacterium]